MTTPNEVTEQEVSQAVKTLADGGLYRETVRAILEQFLQSRTSATSDAAITQSEQPTALEQYQKGMAGDLYEPIENLRYFCSKAMNGQDWLDAGPFFDAIAQPEQPTAQPAGDAERYRFLEHQCRTGTYSGIISREAIDAAIAASRANTA